MDYNAWLTTLSTWTLNSIWSSVWDWVVSLLNIVISFLPWMLAITALFFIIRIWYKFLTKFVKKDDDEDKAVVVKLSWKWNKSLFS